MFEKKKKKTIRKKKKKRSFSYELKLYFFFLHPHTTTDARDRMKRNESAGRDSIGIIKMVFLDRRSDGQRRALATVKNTIK